MKFALIMYALGAVATSVGIGLAGGIAPGIATFGAFCTVAAGAAAAHYSWND